MILQEIIPTFEIKLYGNTISNVVSLSSRFYNIKSVSERLRLFELWYQLRGWRYLF